MCIIGCIFQIETFEFVFFLNRVSVLFVVFVFLNHSLPASTLMPPLIKPVCLYRSRYLTKVPRPSALLTDQRVTAVFTSHSACHPNLPTPFNDLIIKCTSGPITNGKPALSNEAACSAVAAFLSAYSFDSSSLTIDASFASVCRGVLLAAVDSAPSVCACKFFVPHFSSFGVRELSIHCA